jgi:hypothetical protein
MFYAKIMLNQPIPDTKSQNRQKVAWFNGHCRSTKGQRREFEGQPLAGSRAVHWLLLP